MNGDDDKPVPSNALALINNPDALKQLSIDTAVPGIYEGVMNKDDDTEIRQELSNSILDLQVAAAYGVTPETVTSEFLENKIEEASKHQRIRLKEFAERSGGQVVGMDVVEKQAAQLDETIKQMKARFG